MADRFNFGEVARTFKSIEREFINKGIELAREEMITNISSQSSAESGKEYPELTYLIDWRPKNPPRLVLTGQLFEEIKSNKIQIIGSNYGILTIDPEDEKGRGYASYHQEGENNIKSKDEFQSEFVTQSDSLANKQVNLLESLVNKAFI